MLALSIAIRRARCFNDAKEIAETMLEVEFVHVRPMIREVERSLSDNGPTQEPKLQREEESENPGPKRPWTPKKYA